MVNANLSYLIIEISIAALFLLACYHASRRRAFLEIASAAFYGLMLEEGDMLIFKTYHYSQDFVFRLDRVPVAIALAWAIIIYTCMHISDAFGLPLKAAPFADAIWAVSLDLAFDAVAIRLGFWTWVIPLDAGFFGVPAGNFYAWLFVAFAFSLFTRLARKRRARADGRKGAGLWQLAVPLLAYAGLLAAMIPFILLRQAFFPEEGGGLPVFWAVLALFVVPVAPGLAMRRNGGMRFDWLPVLLRGTFHVYFLAALLLNGIYLALPALLAVSSGMLTLEILLAFLWWSQSNRANAVGRQSQA